MNWNTFYNQALFSLINTSAMCSKVGFNYVTRKKQRIEILSSKSLRSITRYAFLQIVWLCTALSPVSSSLSVLRVKSFLNDTKTSAAKLCEMYTNPKGKPDSTGLYLAIWTYRMTIVIIDICVFWVKWVQHVQVCESFWKCQDMW